MTRQTLPAMKRNGGSPFSSSPSYVHSRITVYHSSKIDLKYCRSFHSCGFCRLGQVKDQCGAVHFGVCAPVAKPSGKIRRKSGSYATFSPSYSIEAVKGSSPFRDGNLSSASRPENFNTRKIRSLAILREGHELAGMHMDNRAVVHHPSGLLRLYPQTDVVLPGSEVGYDVRGGDRGSVHASDVVASSGISSDRGRGMAITVSRADISHTGGADIHIKGQGGEIRIKSSGNQNIRFHPAVGSSGRSGHVIRVKGQGDGDLVQFIEGGVVRHAHQPLPGDNVDSSRLSSVPGFINISPTDKLQTVKPIARVAPAPVVPPKPTSPTTSPPSLPSPRVPVFSLSTESQSRAQSFPAAPAPPESASLRHTPVAALSSSSSATSPVTSPVAALSSSSSATSPVTSPAAVATETGQPFLPGNTKEHNAGNHGNLAAPSTHKQTSNPMGVSDHISRKRRLFQQEVESFRNSHKVPGEDIETFLRTPPLQDSSSQSWSDPDTSDVVSHTSVQDHVNKHSTFQHIPQFYFPFGKPVLNLEATHILQKVAQLFARLDGGKAYKEQMGSITKTCGFPLYWKILLFREAGGSSEGFVTYESLSDLLLNLHNNFHDSPSRFLKLAAKHGSAVLQFEDFEPLVQDIIETHPGLTFLQDAPEFHTRYVITVISRIMFSVNRSWTEKITLQELRKSNFLQTVLKLEQEDDINQITDYFSYEHFYVIYCKFWELDKDHDLFIDRDDLSYYNDHALSSRIIDRIFSGAVTRGSDFQEGRMNYKEFVWFLIAEVDKKHPTSIEYWFRCMDLDGDGVLSMYEMEYFHEEQMIRLETLGIERLPFEDTLCQMIDMVNPKQKGRISLGDLKACKMTDIFFDTFINLDKFLEHEQKDPFANARDLGADHYVDNDWNRYADDEYDNLVASEGSADLDNGNCIDGLEFGVDDDYITSAEVLQAAGADLPQKSPGQLFPAIDDVYGFTSAPRTDL